jgi:hypothetical protein
LERPRRYLWKEGDKEKQKDLHACTTQLGRNSIRGKDQLRIYPSRIYHQPNTRGSWSGAPKSKEGFIVLDESHYFVSPASSFHSMRDSMKLPPSLPQALTDLLKVWNKAQQIIVAGIHLDGLNFLRTRLDGTSNTT